MKKLLLFSIAFLIFIYGCQQIADTEPAIAPTTTQLIGCPEDARVCPDGSVVVRVPPNCEFQQCPEVKEGDCLDRFKRVEIKEDGTREEFCVSPEELGLKKQCNSNDDCSSIEACIDNYCTVVLGGDLTCTTDSDCPRGTVCTSNFCITT